MLGLGLYRGFLTVSLLAAESSRMEGELYVWQASEERESQESDSNGRSRCRGAIQIDCISS